MERRHFKTSEMLRAVGMMKDGQSQARIARVLNTSRSVINRLWQDRFLVLHTKRQWTITAWHVISVIQYTWSCYYQPFGKTIGHQV
ncbi:hypothetical protein ANN_06655 [Periplaneta americana]|uniref:Transposase IS30-like HTH domain-containing protein n=1 Tax=Periplaneta americana TaxID=6978 RepID=A0ABQ8TFY9_PERAM|nr:hypothetical protein ANN_06655 [Periplaneta americana]